MKVSDKNGYYKVLVYLLNVEILVRVVSRISLYRSSFVNYLYLKHHVTESLTIFLCEH